MMILAIKQWLIDHQVDPGPPRVVTRPTGPENDLTTLARKYLYDRDVTGPVPIWMDPSLGSHTGGYMFVKYIHSNQPSDKNKHQ